MIVEEYISSGSSFMVLFMSFNGSCMVLRMSSMVSFLESFLESSCVVMYGVFRGVR